MCTPWYCNPHFLCFSIFCKAPGKVLASTQKGKRRRVQYKPLDGFENYLIFTHKIIWYLPIVFRLGVTEIQGTLLIAFMEITCFQLTDHYCSANYYTFFNSRVYHERDCTSSWLCPLHVCTCTGTKRLSSFNSGWRLIALLLSQRDTSLWSLKSSFYFSNNSLTLLLLNPFWVFFSINFSFASVLFSNCLGLCAVSFSSVPLQTTSSMNLLSSFSPLPWFIVKELQGVQPLERQRPTCRSRTSLILLPMLFGNTFNISEWVLVLDIKSMWSHSVVNEFFASCLWVNLRGNMTHPAMTSLHLYENGSFQNANPWVTYRYPQFSESQILIDSKSFGHCYVANHYVSKDYCTVKALQTVIHQ